MAKNKFLTLTLLTLIEIKGAKLELIKSLFCHPEYISGVQLKTDNLVKSHEFN
jgi:hypothetical protein